MGNVCGGGGLKPGSSTRKINFRWSYKFKFIHLYPLSASKLLAHYTTYTHNNVRIIFKDRSLFSCVYCGLKVCTMNGPFKVWKSPVVDFSIPIPLCVLVSVSESGECACVCLAASLRNETPPARSIRFSKIMSDFCSRGLNHLILYLKRRVPRRTFSSKN